MKSLRQELAQIKKSNQKSDLKKLDLNLLTVFVKIFHCSRNTSSDPVLSQSLLPDSLPVSKLSQYFDDPLFVMRGERLVATSLAEELYLRINKELSGLLNSVEKVSSYSKVK